MNADLTRAMLAVVLDEGRLSVLAGRPVRVDRLRIKPEVSLVLALVAPDGRPCGWGRVLWPVAHGKAAKARDRACRHGVTLDERRLAGDLVWQAGAIADDPQLGPHLRAAVGAGLTADPDAGAILRYNPLRRVVLAEPEAIMRVTAASQARMRALHGAVAARVSVPELLPSGVEGTRAGAHLGRQRRVGDTNLAHHAEPATHAAAGAQFAALHRCADALPGPLFTGLEAHPHCWQRQARAHALLLDVLAPQLAAAVRALTVRMPAALPGRTVLTHGDASPDQVLLDSATGRVWLTDFDRASLAPAADDLGAYLVSADPQAGDAFLSGYAAAGGELPTLEALRPAMAASLLRRLADPLRSGLPDWRARIAATLERLEGLLP